MKKDFNLSAYIDVFQYRKIIDQTNKDNRPIWQLSVQTIQQTYENAPAPLPKLEDPVARVNRISDKSNAYNRMIMDNINDALTKIDGLTKGCDDTVRAEIRTNALTELQEYLKEDKQQENTPSWKTHEAEYEAVKTNTPDLRPPPDIQRDEI